MDTRVFLRGESTAEPTVDDDVIQYFDIETGFSKCAMYELFAPSEEMAAVRHKELGTNAWNFLGLQSRVVWINTPAPIASAKNAVFFGREDLELKQFSLHVFY